MKTCSKKSSKQLFKKYQVNSEIQFQCLAVRLRTTDLKGCEIASCTH